MVKPLHAPLSTHEGAFVYIQPSQALHNAYLPQRTAGQTHIHRPQSCHLCPLSKNPTLRLAGFTGFVSLCNQILSAACIFPPVRLFYILGPRTVWQVEFACVFI